MKMPGFKAEASPYGRNVPYYMIHLVGTDFGEQDVIAAGLVDWLCKLFPWICGETSPPTQCVHYKTDAACVGVSLWCNASVLPGTNVLQLRTGMLDTRKWAILTFFVDVTEEVPF
jgi:hypothetical protein